MDKRLSASSRSWVILHKRYRRRTASRNLSRGRGRKATARNTKSLTVSTGDVSELSRAVHTRWAEELPRNSCLQFGPKIDIHRQDSVWSETREAHKIQFPGVCPPEDSTESRVFGYCSGLPVILLSGAI